MTKDEIDRIRAVMKRCCSDHPDSFSFHDCWRALDELVQEFGIDIVAAQACQMGEHGGTYCTGGECARPDGFGAEVLTGEPCTCQEACAAFHEYCAPGQVYKEAHPGALQEAVDEMVERAAPVTRKMQ